MTDRILHLVQRTEDTCDGIQSTVRNKTVGNYKERSVCIVELSESKMFHGIYKK